MTITLQNKNYTTKAFIRLKKEELPSWAIPAQSFLQSWKSGEDLFIQQTSGSTGEPKEISISRTQMKTSAQNTINALKLPSRSKAFHCINSAFIGGKMMWVRAMIGDWHVHLVKPKGHFNESELCADYDFAAMVPLQVAHLLNDPKSNLLDRIGQLIIGGAAVPESMIDALQKVQASCYSTFGMTETVSHIALRALNGDQKSVDYQLVGDNEITLDKRGCLQVKGQVTNDKWITTNDVVEMTKDGFHWLGRYDLIVNSGGIKIQLEKAEEALQTQLRNTNHQFFFWKRAHEILGEELIGMSDSKVFIEYLKANTAELKKKLPEYHLPKKWLLCQTIVHTESNKVDRAATALRCIEEFNL